MTRRDKIRNEHIRGTTRDTLIDNIFTNQSNCDTCNGLLMNDISDHIPVFSISVFTSSFFIVTNGVRQGGILSPFLFTLYIDELSHQLNNSKVGCHINNVCINHLFDADDLCLMAPSPVGPQHLCQLRL